MRRYKYPQIESAILYGSRAKGNYKRGSDIDLTLTGSDVDLPLVHKIETALNDLLLPYTFDLSACCYLNNPDLPDHIERVENSFTAPRRQIRGKTPRTLLLKPLFLRRFFTNQTPNKFSK